MSSYYLKNRANKKINQFKNTIFLCLLAFIGLSLKGSYQFINDFIENPISKKGFKHHKSKIPNFATAFIYAVLAYFAIKELKKLPKPSKTPTVSDDILNTLKYNEKNQTQDIYAPLDKADIRSLTKRIDFSALNSKTQKNILQNIIKVSKLSPFVSKILRSDLMYSSVFINDNMNSGGLFSYKPTLLEKGVISVKNYDNVIPLIHEIFHAKQLKDGASSLVELQHYSRLTNEAAAKGLNLILEVKTKDMFLENETAIDTLWVKKILCKRLTNLQTNKLLTDAEHCYGEEETIGIIMHCLLENNPKKREEHLKYFCGDIFTSKDFQAMNEECEDWRASYVNEKILQKETDLEKTLNHAPNTVNEISLVPFFNAYNSNETHIPQTFESIKIRKNQHQNVLAKFLAQESQHTK